MAEIYVRFVVAQRDDTSATPFGEETL